jgi:DNA-binding XRE family transcriptional regulator
MILYEDEKLKGLKSNLKKARIIQGYTQESLANLSGVNIKSIASYEQNPEKLSSASVSTCIKLADALGCEVTDIVNFPIK